VTLWLVFFLMSIVFCFGWALGSGLGYQNGRADAESLFELQQQLLQGIEDHLANDATGPMPATAAAG
jgi:hypothetical protein